MNISNSSFKTACVFLVTAILSLQYKTPLAEETMQLPPARKIPALTAEDPFPTACVDCHINMPERNQNERLSKIMARLEKGGSAKLLEKAKAVSPTGLKIKGIHPKATMALKNIPSACITCHDKFKKKAPPFAPLIHTIHLTGGGENRFLTIFQGECTYCHKLDTSKGLWKVPSGAEK